MLNRNAGIVNLNHYNRREIAVVVFKKWELYEFCRVFGVITLEDKNLASQNKPLEIFWIDNYRPNIIRIEITCNGVSYTQTHTLSDITKNFFLLHGGPKRIFSFTTQIREF